MPEQYSDLPKGAKVVGGPQYSDLPPGAKIVQPADLQIAVPDRGTILAKARAEHPGWAQMGDDELAQHLTETLKAGSVSSKAAANLDSMKTGAGAAQFAHIQQDAQSDINTHVDKATRAIEMLPFVAAAPFTGGTSLAGGMLMMGGAGLTGGLLREGTKKVAGADDFKTGQALATSLGVDTVTGMLGEAVGRGIGAVGKTMFPGLIQKSAMSASKGLTWLEGNMAELRNALYGELDKAAVVASSAPPVVGQAANAVKPIMVDVGNVLKKGLNDIANIPRGSTPLTTRFGGMTEKAAEAVESFEKSLVTTNGTVSSHQPLKELVRAAGSLQQMAFGEKSLAWEERVVFKQVAENLLGAVKKGVESVGPRASALLEQGNKVMQTLNNRNVMVGLAEDTLKRAIGRAGIGAAVGGGVGYRSGGIGGAVKGAAEGAVAGLATSAIQKAVPNVSLWMLQQVMAHPQAAKAATDAVAFAVKGDRYTAGLRMARAVGMAQVREPIKNFFEKIAATSQRLAAPQQPAP